MRQFSRGSVGFTLAVVAAAVLDACQGNIGGGSGLSIPQAPGYQQPAGPGGANPQSRERVLDGAVYLSSKLTSVPLPQVGGFAVTIALGSPGPIPTATSSPAPGTHAGPLAKVHGAKSLAAAAASVVAIASPSATPSPGTSASPGADASGSPSAKPSSSPGAEGSAPAAASSSAASPAPKATHSASPGPAGTTLLPRIDTKTTVYPDDAPPPPTPMPTGEVQTFTKRSPIVRGYVRLGTDVPLYGLGAVHFTLPSTELTPKRGFTIALFESGKHNHHRLMDYDTDPVIESGVVHSAMTDPIVLKKGSGYLLMIYGDDEPAAPSTVAPGYPSPGNNPFPVGSGGPQPGYTQVPYPGQGTPYPPGYSPTPYPPGYAPPPTPIFGSPHP